MDFDQVPCPHCGHVQNASLQPGQRWKCRGCRTWFRIPTVREAARQELTEALAACKAAERDAEARHAAGEFRLAAVVVALLSGLPRADVRQVLVEQGLEFDETELLLERATPHVRQGARQAGVALVVYGILLLVAGVAVTGITYLFSDVLGGVFMIALGAFATGFVLILLGVVKLVTGWNLH